MRVLKIFNKDIYTEIEFSSDEIDMIIKYLDNCTATYDGVKNPDIKAADIYIKDRLYPNLKELLSAMKEV